MQSLEQVNLSGKVGLVLLNMGGPKGLEDIRPFLYNLFSDPDIINLPRFLKPFQRQIAWLIAKFRTPGTTAMYEQIGNGSPILGITEDLGENIVTSLNFPKAAVQSFVAMRYTPPRANEVVERLMAEDIDHLILFSQYPHYADSTTGSSIREFYKIMEELGYNPKSVFEIDEWGTEPEYINWWVEGITQVIEKNNIDLNDSVHLIFSAHGLPQRYVDNGEEYPNRIKEAAALVINQLGDLADSLNTHVSFQSQAGPVEWTKPYTDDLLDEITEMGAKTVIVVPLGFVSNHVETLYEIDILYGDKAKRIGIENYYRVEVPDADKTYAKAMAGLIARRMEDI